MYFILHPYSDGTVVTEDGQAVTLKDVLAFCTGADSVPALGFPQQPCQEFLHSPGDVFATASTCDLNLRLPTGHHMYSSFRDAIYDYIFQGSWRIWNDLIHCQVTTVQLHIYIHTYTPYIHQ